jgi:hypothetical protein
MSEPAFEYGIYGLRLRSNRQLAGFAEPRDGAPLVTLDFAGAPEPHAQQKAPFWTNGFETLWHRNDGRWLLRYDDLRDGAFWTLELDPAGSHMTVRWSSQSLLDDVPAVLQGPGLAALLHLRGVTMLHASVIAVGDAAIALIGEPGAGKSTTAAAFVTNGFASMSDDLAALSSYGVIRVHSGYPRLRAFPDSLHAAGLDPDTLPRVFVDESLGPKRYLTLSEDEGSFHSSPLPLRAVYYLMTRVVGSREPRIEALSVRQSLPILLQNLYSTRFLDNARRITLIRNVAGIAATVPLRAVQAGDDLAALPRLVAAIASDAAATGASIR